MQVSWEELLSEQKYQLCSFDSIDFFCVFKSDCLSSSFSVWLPLLITWPHHLQDTSHNLQLPVSNIFYCFQDVISWYFALHLSLLWFYCSSAMICLQPGIIAWNVPRQIFILFQTYLCYLSQVLFVCTLSDIFLLDLNSVRKEEIFRKTNSPSFSPRKKFFMKHKAKLMGNDYLT